jgi:hypothetical protein
MQRCHPELVEGWACNEMVMGVQAGGCEKRGFVVKIGAQLKFLVDAGFRGIATRFL